MIIETGKVVSVEPEGLWVETISRSVCGTCKAEKGCGQSLMAKWSGHTSYIWVLLEGRNPDNYQPGDSIQIGIPEDIIAKGSMIVYLVPLMVMLLVTVLAHRQFANEVVTVISAIAGLLLGGAIIRWHAWKTRFDPRLQPVLVDDREKINLIEPSIQ
jgi:sigma-E factor negative regulatory protein RseC